MKTLEEVIKNKAFIISSLNKHLEEVITMHCYSPIIFSSTTTFKKDIVIDNSIILYKILKPFIYYSFSFTIKEHPERCFNFHHFNDCSDTFHHVKFFNYDYEYVSDEENIIELNKKKLMRYEEEIYNKNCFYKFTTPFSLLIEIKTFTKGNEEDETEELSNSLPIEMHPPNHNFTGPGILLARRLGVIPDNEEENEEEQIINTDKSFKSDECVICLTKPPNVLFCNCGHLCLCEECQYIY